MIKELIKKHFKRNGFQQLQEDMKSGTRLPLNARYGYRKGKDGRLEIAACDEQKMQR